MKTRESKLIFSAFIDLLNEKEGVEESLEKIGTQNLWDEFYDSSLFHGVFPQVNAFIQQSTSVPLSVRERFQTFNKEQTIHQLTLVAEYLRLHEIFEQKGISILPFKGWWIGHSIYENLGARNFLDVDLFIEKKHFIDIKDIFTQEGYEPIALMAEVRDDYWLRVHNEYAFLKWDFNQWLNFDIHWKLGPPKFGLDLTLEDLKDHITTVSFKGKQLKVFDESATMALLILHHGSKDLWRKLRQLNDLRLLLESKNADIDWDWVLKIAQKFHSEKLLFIGLGLVHQLFQTQVPEIFKKGIADPDIQRMILYRLNKLPAFTRDQEKIHKEKMEWLFRMKARSNNRVRFEYTRYFFKGFLVSLVPEKYHRYFFNKKIRWKES